MRMSVVLQRVITTNFIGQVQLAGDDLLRVRITPFASRRRGSHQLHSSYLAFEYYPKAFSPAAPSFLSWQGMSHLQMPLQPQVIGVPTESTGGRASGAFWPAAQKMRPCRELLCSWALRLYEVGVWGGSCR